MRVPSELAPLLQLGSLQRLYFVNCGLSAESFSDTPAHFDDERPHLTALGWDATSWGPTAEHGVTVGEMYPTRSPLATPVVDRRWKGRDICQGLAAMTVAASSRHQRTPVCSLQSLT
jgi:hypothetical protein